MKNPVIDKKKPGYTRIIRGGSCDYDERRAQVYDRYVNHPRSRDPEDANYGFRVVRNKRKEE